MGLSLRTALWCFFVSVSTCACAPGVSLNENPLRELTRRIASHPDSTAVLVLFADDLLEDLRARVPESIAVVPFSLPGPGHEELYHLALDPGEHQALPGGAPPDLRAELDGFPARFPARERTPVELDEATLEHMGALGYAVRRGD